MTTDLLWRWKMSLPSDSHVAETFWQQFMLMLARTTSGRGLLLVKNSVTAQAGRSVSVRVDAASGNAPKVEATSPSGAKIPLSLEPEPNVTDGQQVQFIPDSGGRWEITASDAAGNFARVTMPVGAKKTRGGIPRRPGGHRAPAQNRRGHRRLAYRKRLRRDPPTHRSLPTAGDKAHATALGLPMAHHRAPRPLRDGTHCAADGKIIVTIVLHVALENEAFSPENMTGAAPWTK